MPLYLTHPDRPPQQVVAYHKDTNVFVGKFADGRVLVDPNFHIDIVKRCGYSLTAEVPEEFQEN